MSVVQDPECLYVAEGTGGLLKVGRTTSPRDRIKALRRGFLDRGDKLSRMVTCDYLRSARDAEFFLIHALAMRLPRAKGDEWFRWGHFDNALRAAQELTAFFIEVKGNRPQSWQIRDEATRRLPKRTRKASP